MICPPLKSEERRQEFNGLIMRLGGKPLEEIDVLDRSEYLRGLNKGQKDAYNRLYYLWNENKGEAADITRVLDHIDSLQAAAAGPAPKEKLFETEPAREPRTVGVKKKDVEASREARGLSPVQQQMYKTLGPSYAHGRQAVESGRVDPRALALDVSRTPRQITPSEIGALGYDRARIVEAHQKTTDQLAEAINRGDTEAAKNFRINLNQIEADYARNDEALRRGSRENSAGLNAMKMVVGEDYNLVAVVNRMTVAKGSPLTKDERAEVERVVYVENKADKALQDRLAALEKENVRLRAQGKANDLKRETRIGPARGTKEKFKAVHDSLIAELARLSKKAPPTQGMFELAEPERQTDSPEFKRWFGDSKVVDEDGEPLVVYHGTKEDFDRFEAWFKQRSSGHPTARAGFFFSNDPGVAAAFSGHEVNPQSWPPKLVYREGSKIIPAFLSIKNPIEISASDFIAQYVTGTESFEGFAESAKGRGYDGIKILRDPRLGESLSGDEYAGDTWVAFVPTQIKSATANVGSFGTEDPRIMFDLAEEEMTAENPDLIRIIKALSTSWVGQGLNTAEEVTAAIKKDLEPFAPSITEREIADIWSGYGRARQPNMEELAVRLREVGRQQRLINALEDAEAGESPKRSGYQQDKPSQRVLDLRKAVKAAMVQNAVKIEKTKKSPEEQWRTALQAYKKRLATETAKIKKKIAEKDFSKKKRGPMKLDREALRLRGEREGQRAILEKMADEHKKAESKQGFIGKATYYIPRWIRWSDLSSALVLLKLSAYAGFKNISTPIEMLYSAGLSKVPGLRGIYAKSPYYSGGLNLEAELASLKTIFNHITVGPESSVWQEMLNARRTGQTKIDLVYGGKKVALDPDFIEFWGRVHSALKTQPKIAEFQRAFIRLKDFEYRARIAQGMSPEAALQEIEEPEFQIGLGMMAYVYANRAILMNDNQLNTLYRTLLRLVESEKNGKRGQLASAIIRSFLPIVKVGTNFTFETTEYLFGPGKAFIRMALAGGGAGKGSGGGGIPPGGTGGFADRLTPEDADYIARNINRGAMMATFLGFLGLLLYVGFRGLEFGGYYVAGEKKRGSEDVQVGGVRFFGMDLPGWMVHNPAVNALQFYATVYRILDAKRKGNKEASYTDALVQSSLALFEEIPFLGEPVRAIRESEQPGGVGKFITAPVRSAVLPPDIQRLARATDPEEKAGLGHVVARMLQLERPKVIRRPKGVAEEFEAVTPGLRTNVPIVRGMPDKVGKELDAVNQKITAPKREEGESPEDYKARADRHTKQIARTLPEIIESDEYRQADKSGKKKLLEFGIKEARKDAEAKVEALPEERDLALERSAALTEAETKLKAKLGKVDKETLAEAKRQLNGIFRTFSTKQKDIQKMSPETRAAQAKRKGEILQRYLNENVINRQVDRIASRFARSAI